MAKDGPVQTRLAPNSYSKRHCSGRMRGSITQEWTGTCLFGFFVVIGLSGYRVIGLSAEFAAAWFG
jgi:hypothetical protein